eukprot:TRINITY_DN17820_c0_g1_i2.p1 TRINITY_DN17820_c0_g1~~TRINITY_DN17820_c0_g1_i2.p1  ORF type:complete len:2350 (+),score=199.52 TRINITY_DN17820_c0_g1_i2:76-7050(+)
MAPRQRRAGAAAVFMMSVGAVHAHFVEYWVGRVQHWGCKDPWGAGDPDYDIRISFRTATATGGWSIREVQPCIRNSFKGDRTRTVSGLHFVSLLNAERLEVSVEAEDDDAAWGGECKQDSGDECKVSGTCDLWFAAVPATLPSVEYELPCKQPQGRPGFGHRVYIRYRFHPVEPTVSPTGDPTTSPTHAPSHSPSLSPTHAPSLAPVSFDCPTWVFQPCAEGQTRKYTGDCGTGSFADILCTGGASQTDCIKCAQCCEKVNCTNAALPGSVQPYADYSKCYGSPSSAVCNYSCTPGWRPTKTGATVQCRYMSTSISAQKNGFYDFTGLTCEPYSCTHIVDGTAAEGVDYSDCFFTPVTAAPAMPTVVPTGAPSMAPLPPSAPPTAAPQPTGSPSASTVTPTVSPSLAAKSISGSTCQVKCLPYWTPKYTGYAKQTASECAECSPGDYFVRSSPPGPSYLFCRSQSGYQGCYTPNRTLNGAPRYDKDAGRSLYRHADDQRWCIGNVGHPDSHVACNMELSGPRSPVKGNYSTECMDRRLWMRDVEVATVLLCTADPTRTPTAHPTMSPAVTDFSDTLALVCDRETCPQNAGVCQGAFDASVPFVCDPNSCSRGPLSGTSDTIQWPSGFGVKYESCSALHTGQTCKPICPIGHHLSPADGFVLQCTSAGYFDAQHHANASRRVSCVPNNCTDGPTNYTYDRFIQNSSAWQENASVPTDAAISKATTSDGYSRCSQAATGTTCKPQCRSGWHAVPEEFGLTCIDKRYDASSVCTPYPCHRVTGNDTENATIADFSVCNTLHSGQTCWPSCKPGYKLLGKIYMVCNKDGEYNAPRESARCDPYNCSLGPVNGTLALDASYDDCNRHTTDMTCKPDCDARNPGEEGGRTLMGVAGANTGFQLKCFENGSYTAPFAYCHEHDCSQGPRGFSGDARADYSTCNSRQTGQDCSPQCEPGYTISGVLHLVCASDNTYPAGAVKCTANNCSGGPDSGYGLGLDSRTVDTAWGYSACTKSETGAMCKPACPEGWALQGALAKGFKLLCSDANGSLGATRGFENFTSQPFQYHVSAIRCEPYPCSGGRRMAGDDTHIDLNNDCSRLTSGQPCEPKCTKGYKLDPPGPVEMVCRDDFTYDFKALGKECVANVCGPCYYNATEMKERDEQKYGNLKKCEGSDPQGNYTQCEGLKTHTLCKVACSAGYTPTPESLNLSCNEVGEYNARDVRCVAMYCLPSCAVKDNRCRRCHYGMTADIVHSADQGDVECHQIRTLESDSYMFGRPLVMSNLGCDTMYWDAENMTETNWMLCPLQTPVAVGSEHLKHIRGCIVGNTVFCIAFALVVTTGLAIRASVRAGRKVSLQVLRKELTRVNMTRIVSLMALPHSFTVTGTSCFAIILLWRSPLPLDKAIAIIGLAIFIAHPVLLGMLVLRPGRFRAKAVAFEDAEQHPIRSFFVGKKEWVPASDRYPHFVYQHGFSFVWWRKGFHAWMVVESAQSILVGVIAGWATTSKELCTWRNIILIGILGVYSVSVLLARPARALLTNLMIITTAGCLLCSVVFLNLGFGTFYDNSHLVDKDEPNQSLGGTIGCTILTYNRSMNFEPLGEYKEEYYRTAQWFLKIAALTQVLKGLADFTAQLFDTITVTEQAQIEGECNAAKEQALEYRKEQMAVIFSGEFTADGTEKFLREVDDLGVDFSQLRPGQRRWRQLRRAVLFGKGVHSILDRREIYRGNVFTGRLNIAGTEVEVLPVAEERKPHFGGPGAPGAAHPSQDDTAEVGKPIRVSGAGDASRAPLLATSLISAQLGASTAGPRPMSMSPLSPGARSPTSCSTSPPQRTVRVLADTGRLQQIWLEDAGRAGCSRFKRNMKHLAGRTATVLQEGLQRQGSAGLGALLQFPSGEKQWWPARCLEGVEAEPQAGPRAATPEQPPEARPRARPEKRTAVKVGRRVQILRDEAAARSSWTAGGGRGAEHYFERHLRPHLGAVGVVHRVDRKGAEGRSRAALVKFDDGTEDWWPVDCIEAIDDGASTAALSLSPGTMGKSGLLSTRPSPTWATQAPPATPPAPGTRMRVPADAGRVRAAWVAAGGQPALCYFLQHLTHALGRSGEVLEIRKADQRKGAQAGHCAVLLRIGVSEDWWPLTSLVPCESVESRTSTGPPRASSSAAVSFGRLKSQRPPVRSPDARAASSAVLSQRTRGASGATRPGADADLFAEPLLDQQASSALGSCWGPLPLPASRAPSGRSKLEKQRPGAAGLSPQAPSSGSILSPLSLLTPPGGDAAARTSSRKQQIPPRHRRQTALVSSPSDPPLSPHPPAGLLGGGKPGNLQPGGRADSNLL